jgi:hypothetical protein
MKTLIFADLHEPPTAISRGLAIEVLGALCRAQSACDELGATILGLVQRRPWGLDYNSFDPGHITGIRTP